jgi:hypothetical protein
MPRRPKVFEREDVEAKLRALGISADSIGPTITFMRLVIPLVIQKVGTEGIVRFFEDAAAELGRTQQVGWREKMAAATVKWAEACLEEYKKDGLAKKREKEREKGTHLK